MAGTTSDDSSRPSRPRVYSPDFRAAALARLAANGGNYRRTARELGVTHRIVRSWAAKAGGASGGQTRPGPRAVQSALARAIEAFTAQLATLVNAEVELDALEGLTDAELDGLAARLERVRLGRGPAMPTALDGPLEACAAPSPEDHPLPSEAIS